MSVTSIILYGQSVYHKHKQLRVTRLEMSTKEQLSFSDWGFLSSKQP